MRSSKWLPVSLVLSITLAACGFHLRQAQPLNFHSLYLDAAPTQPFTRALERALGNQHDLVLTHTAKEAEVKLKILADQREQSILSLTTAGRVRELTLRQRVRFQLQSTDAEEPAPPADLVVERVLSFNDSDTLAKDNEEALIYQEMQKDCVRLLMLRLAAFKPGRDGK